MNLFLFGVSSDVLEKAGLNTILGLGIVFIMLFLISAIISSFKYINKLENRMAKVEKAVAPAAPVAPVETVVNEIDDLELVAVITAAIHEYEAAQGNNVPAGALVVRSIRKVNKIKWQKAY